MKLTPWFDGKVKPVREGWYECRETYATKIQKDFWNGEKWCYIDMMGWIVPFSSGQDDCEWRGILK